LLRELQSNVNAINKKVGNEHPEYERGKALLDSIDQVLRTVFPDKKTQGIYRDASLVQNKLQIAGYIMAGPLVPWTPNQALALQQAEQAVNALVEDSNHLINTLWTPYRQTMLNEPLLLPEVSPVSAVD